MEALGNELSWILANLDTLMAYGAAIIATSSAVSVLVDSDNSDPFIARLIAFIDILALNFGKARNADKTTTITGAPPSKGIHEVVEAEIEEAVAGVPPQALIDPEV